MTSIELSEILSASGAPLQIVTTGLVALQSRSIRRMENQLATLAGHRHPSAHCKPPLGPLALLCLVIVAAGCQSVPPGVRFSFGFDFEPPTTNTVQKSVAPASALP